MRRRQSIVWRGLDAWRAEYCHLSLYADRLLARGIQIGVDPLPYRLEYALDTAIGWDTARLTVDASGEGWARRLDLIRDTQSRWHVSADGRGSGDLPEPGGDPAEFEEARDCDLGFCPLTNTMPILREGVRDGNGPVDLVMAWVSVPDLRVIRSEQRYEPIDRHRVRYVGKHRDFVGELELDDDGLVVRYPDLAERVGAR
ncbi:MAG TPA: putative glycolipid-binding domain-containing protein [Thermoleophilaceae bacterium]|nr:putative glycolipid-binding domain-containing protein [Thermoleophilaceae bacterium]